MASHGGNAGSGEISRKKSLIRPERRRNDSDDPNYHYRKHAQRMAVHPSTTGHDPVSEEHEVGTHHSDSTDAKAFPQHGQRLARASTSQSPPSKEKYEDIPLGKKGDRKLRRHHTQRELQRREKREMIERDRASVKPPSLWNIYCAAITFWCPDAVLRCFGKPQKAQQRAWREKMGLLSIIAIICTFVGYLTFGFTQTVCPPGASNRIRTNEVGEGFMVFHGKAIDLSYSHHPLARGIQDRANVCYDIPNDSGGKKLGYGGYDGSFLFQNVNGACKGLITAKAGSDVPTDSDGNLGWYFPCRPFKQDGSSKPNFTTPVYSGYSCHTSKVGREQFYGLNIFGDVFFTWDDVRNSSRPLMVFGSDVLDLSLLDWFNTTAISYPAKFDEIRNNTSLRGLDVTRSFSSSTDKQIGKCLSQIIKVGSVDTTSVGCIASKVVLYVSLVFILAIVLAKFFLALAFQWVLSRKFAADKGVANSKQRKQQIEDWSDDIYRPPPKLTDPAGSTFGDRSSKRSSVLFPTTSRFTSPYAIDRTTGRPGPTTMASQSSTTKLIPGSNSLYKQGNHSQGTLQTGDTRSSMALDSEGPGPAGFIHEAVVPQPPPEWQPFGYPLAHTICLVTAYSEGYEGLRTTLDSVATTDYPNSHKLILVVADGMIKGKGETLATPDICLGMMKDHATLKEDVQPFSYVAVASGSKRHNMAKVYAGFYDYGTDSTIPLERQERVPMLVVVKVGTPDEANKSKPGNRGKRDSQIILMSFLQKVMFDERMTELEFEMFNGIWKITGISPDFYEMVLMVDADTKVFPDSLTHMVSAMVKDPEIMGLCGETKIANKRQSWVTMIQVFEYVTLPYSPLPQLCIPLNLIQNTDWRSLTDTLFRTTFPSRSSPSSAVSPVSPAASACTASRRPRAARTTGCPFWPTRMSSSTIPKTWLTPCIRRTCCFWVRTGTCQR
jgi:chitin synthase